MKMSYYTPSGDLWLELDKLELLQLLERGNITIEPSRLSCKHEEFKGKTREFEVAGMTIRDFDEAVDRHVQFLHVSLEKE